MEQFTKHRFGDKFCSKTKRLLGIIEFLILNKLDVSQGNWFGAS